MCGLLFWSNAEDSSHVVNIALNHTPLKLRGPDSVGVIVNNRFVLAHYLLSITGDHVQQPASIERRHCAFNGEIYNANELGFSQEINAFLDVEWSDVEIVNRIASVNGEYAALVVNEKTDELIAITDLFATKPLWIGFSSTDGAWGVASYPTILADLGAVYIKQLPPNSIFYFDLRNGAIKHILRHTKFCLSQHKNSFNDWHIAFEAAVYRRCKTIFPITIPLSAGYDSGAIAAAMISLKLDAEYYSFSAEENLEILYSRHRLLASSASMMNLTPEEAQWHSKMLHDLSPDFMYSAYLANADYLMSFDPGAIGLSAICQHASSKYSRVLLSGQGADEILSDYGFNGTKFSQDSTLAGVFPNDLSNVFPWPNFYGGVNRCYLLKEEYVTGSHGVEGRYPFLDKDVVQEFLWLNSSLKNSAYKAPIASYLKLKDFPVEYNTKKGFNATHSI